MESRSFGCLGLKGVLQKGMGNFRGDGYVPIYLDLG